MKKMDFKTKYAPIFWIIAQVFTGVLINLRGKITPEEFSGYEFLLTFFFLSSFIMFFVSLWSMLSFTIKQP